LAIVEALLLSLPPNATYTTDAGGCGVYHPDGPHGARRNAIMGAKSQADWPDVLQCVYADNGLDRIRLRESCLTRISRLSQRVGRLRWAFHKGFAGFVAV
jgi:hypothetical protein